MPGKRLLIVVTGPVRSANLRVPLQNGSFAQPLRAVHISDAHVLNIRTASACEHALILNKIPVLSGAQHSHDDACGNEKRSLVGNSLSQKGLLLRKHVPWFPE